MNFPLLLNFRLFKARQLSLIKELLSDKDGGSLTSKEKDTIAMLGHVAPAQPPRESYGLSER